jgi:hypothetical protein
MFLECDSDDAYEFLQSEETKFREKRHSKQTPSGKRSESNGIQTPSEKQHQSDPRETAFKPHPRNDPRNNIKAIRTKTIRGNGTEPPEKADSGDAIRGKRRRRRPEFCFG